MKTYSDKQIAESLYLATADKTPKQVDHIIDQLLTWLKQQRSLSKLPAIIQRLHWVHRDKEGIVIIKVMTRTALTPELLKKISHSYAERLQKKIQIEEIIDSAIIGGLKIISPDGQIDLTFNNQLAELQRHLTT